MKDTLLRGLEALPPLHAGTSEGAAVPCKLCGADAPLFDVVDFHKHCALDDQYRFGLSGIEVPYHRCLHCGFLFTSFLDDWTPQDCARFIYNDDYILVDPDYSGARPAQLAVKMATLLRGAEGLRILDYGSGSGLFAARMREAGFSRVESYDPFSSPQLPEGGFDLVTCFEVLEHMPWPHQAMQDMQARLNPGGCLLFSQSIQPPNIAEIRSAWWYLAPRNGHVSLFTVENLTRLLPSADHVLHGNGWLWAMASQDPHTLLSHALREIGPVMAAQPLLAPTLGLDEAWHGREHSPAGAFRWSKARALEWSLAPVKQQTHLTLRLPVLLEIEPNFAARCEMDIGGVPAKLTALRGEIMAEARIEASSAPISVRLLTPEPRSPWDVRGAPDARRLGLGVPVG